MNRAVFILAKESIMQNKEEINRKRREVYICKTEEEVKAVRQFVTKEQKLRRESKERGERKRKNLGIIDGMMRCNKCRKVFVFSNVNFTQRSFKQNICSFCRSKNLKRRMSHIKNNEYLKLILRTRINAAFKRYSQAKRKSKSANEYGIDYQAIIDHIGYCPGNREDYHIDHVLPLSLFNFDDPEQVRIAFLPENHQWLLKEENISKSNKFHLIDFYEYVDKHYKGHRFIQKPDFYKVHKIIHQT
jgi:hypothetical protein